MMPTKPLTPLMQAGMAGLALPTGLATPTPLQGVAFRIMQAYVFISVSRVLELTPLRELRLPLILFILMLITTVATGNVSRVVRSPVWICTILFTGWVFIATLFSTWRGDSSTMAIESLRFCGLVTGILAATSTRSHLTGLIRCLALSSFTAALMGLIWGIDSYGRLVVPTGTFADPNQYAMFLLFGLPLCFMVALTTDNTLLKLASYLAMAPLLYTLLRTGSRGGLMGLLVFFVFMVFRANIQQRILILVTVVVVIPGVFLMLPTYLKARYFTLFDSNRQAEMLAESDAADSNFARERLQADAGSSEARFRLLFDSIAMTLRHPITGVGPGQFPMQNWQWYKDQGQNSAYLTTHNTYTQASSEMGIPGLILLLATIFSGIRETWRGLRNSGSSPPAMRDVLKLMQVTIFIMMMCAFFLSMAYNAIFAIMSAVAAVIAAHVLGMARWAAASPAPPVVPAFAGPPVHPAMAPRPAPVPPTPRRIRLGR